MFGSVRRGCASASRRIWATPPLSVSSLPLASSAVRCASGAAGGKGTKVIELKRFLAMIKVPDKVAARIAGRAEIQRISVSTLRTNYNGLVAILGAEGALDTISRNCGLLTSSPENVSTTRNILVEIMGADRAADAILKGPDVLRHSSGTIEAATRHSWMCWVLTTQLR